MQTLAIDIERGHRNRGQATTIGDYTWNQVCVASQLVRCDFLL